VESNPISLPKIAQATAIPPSRIKVAIAEAQELRLQVETDVKECVKSSHPHENDGG
jgi:hypothetical protein